MKWPLSCEGEDQKWSPNEVHRQQFPQNLPRTPATTPSPGSSSYTVLPPIGKPLRGAESELSPGQGINTAYPIHRCGSGGYLVQMERQKQLRARLTYKVGVSVSFMHVLNGRIVNVHTIYLLCCKMVIFVFHQCIVVYACPCHLICNVTRSHCVQMVH